MDKFRRSAFVGIFLIIFGLITAIFPIIMSSILKSSLAAISYLMILMLIWLGLYLVTSVLGIFFFLGFVELGKKYNKKLLKVISWISIGILSLIAFIMISNLASVFISEIFSITEITRIPLIMIRGWYYLSFVFVPLSILFGTGIIRLKDSVPWSKITGAFQIAAGIIPLLYLVSLILEIKMLFNVSKKNYKTKNNIEKNTEEKIVKE